MTLIRCEKCIDHIKCNRDGHEGDRYIKLPRRMTHEGADKWAYENGWGFGWEEHYCPECNEKRKQRNVAKEGK